VNPLKKVTNTRLMRFLWLVTDTTVAERIPLFAVCEFMYVTR
jgi:hypothetical protein